ncbi:hypothetical protein GCM10010207_28930 [Streptomyces atratus]|nr:hypothetical protein GCM10010207_28930 [Streptomyces atratus]
MYAAVSASVHQAAAFERDWFGLRAEWLAEHGVPVDYELHATRFIPGRGRPGGYNPARLDRYRMAQSALDLIGSHSGVTVTAVHSSVSGDWRRARAASYEGLLRQLDRELAAGGEHAALVVDGDGTEALYGQVHTDVQPARVVRPAQQRPAHESLWLQAADLVAYAAFQSVAQQENRRFMWHWYSRYLPKAKTPLRY